MLLPCLWRVGAGEVRLVTSGKACQIAALALGGGAGWGISGQSVATTRVGARGQAMAVAPAGYECEGVAAADALAGARDHEGG